MLPAAGQCKPKLIIHAMSSPDESGIASACDRANVLPSAKGGGDPQGLMVPDGRPRHGAAEAQTGTKRKASRGCGQFFGTA
jgi:hypothetical protein